MREDWVEIQYKDIVKKISLSNKKLKQKEYLPSGKIPVIDQGQELIGGYTDDESKLLDCKLPCIVFGDHTKIVKLINFPFASGADGTKVIEPKEHLEPKLLKYFTEVLALKIKDKGYARHYQDIEKSDIVIPPKFEQQVIVAKIEQLFSELDNAVANLKTAQAKLKIYRQAVLKKAFEGEFFLKQIDIPQIKICEVIKLIDGDRGKNYPKQTDYFTSGYCLYLSTKNVRPTGFDFSELIFINEDKHNELRSGMLKRGDLVITTRGTIGNVAYYDNSIPFDVVRINSSMLILRIDHSKLLPLFLMYFIQSPKFELQRKEKASGTAQPQLPAGVLKEFIIPLPLIEEQSQIVQEIESRLSVCDKIEETIETSLAKSEALRQSILKKAFEGKLLNEQELKNIKNHPEYESADKLLERIKKERAK